jgi:biotin transport system substrate-specific component
MSQALNRSVLVDMIGYNEGAILRIKQAVLVVAGILALAVSAKIQLPMWPVPMTMGTLAVLTIGAAYGPRLGLTTIIGYMIVGMLGLDVFASSTAENNGWAYMIGGTGGYLFGYVLATLALGFAARKGWDRNPVLLTAALLAGNVLIYVPGLFWLGQLYGWDQPILQWGLEPFWIGDLVKLGMAALILPAIWSIIGNARQ